jgi:hypothetical protein
LHFRALGYLQRIVKLDPKITYSALKLGVPKQELYRIARLPAQLEPDSLLSFRLQDSAPCSPVAES